MFIAPKKSPTKKTQKAPEANVLEEKKTIDKAKARQEKKGEYKMPTIEGEEF